MNRKRGEGGGGGGGRRKKGRKGGWIEKWNQKRKKARPCHCRKTS
jgi:hypothetical protein